MAVLVSMEDLSILRAIEDKLDLDEMKKAMDEPGANIPWGDVKKELGG